MNFKEIAKTVLILIITVFMIQLILIVKEVSKSEEPSKPESPKYNTTKSEEPSKPESPKYNTTKSEEPEMLGLLLKYYTLNYNDGIYYIEGEVENNTFNRYSRVVIIFDVYSSNGALIDNAYDSIENLRPFGKWDFKIPIFANDVGTVKARSLEGTPSDWRKNNYFDRHGIIY